MDEVLPHAPWIIDRTWIGKYNIHLVVQAMISSENTWKMFAKYPLRWEFFPWSLILGASDRSGRLRCRGRWSTLGAGGIGKYLGSAAAPSGMLILTTSQRYEYQNVLSVRLLLGGAETPIIKPIRVDVAGL